MSRRYNYLLKNIGLLTLSNFGSKILVFLMVPLYTSVLSTSDYGTYDLFNTTISLLIPIISINISEGVLRFALDEKNDSSIVYSIGWNIIIKGFLVVVLGIIFNNIFKVSILSIAAILNTISILGFNILFLIIIPLGLVGYFWSNILGLVLPSLYLIYKISQYNIKYTSLQNKKLQQRLVSYSIPLILNSLGWWINNAIDRYVVIAFCGVAVNGIYSVGYKIPSILNIFANIFNQAWILSSVKSYRDEDSEYFFSQVYNKYNMIMVLISGLLISCSKILAKFLYMNEFYDAWKFVPFLLIANVFGAISGFAGGIFSAVKDSKIYSQSTLVGAIVNIIFTFVFVYYYGAIGAAIATMISYFVVWIIRVHTMRKYIKLKIFIRRDVFSYVLLIFQSIVLWLENSYILYPIQVVLFLLLVMLFYKEIKSIIGELKKFLT
ncbi:lipopolysaccharide biosynthesis protein [Streptococcus pneumoniae]|uniref:lipopolysaccharide biosynthesis protein n=1 Tax=Streptococcus pneumoniae TaxID=1313 RepID=UPI001E42B0A8|nr:oligosaccharide flippase family protein [Streptococcus pneumoniae]MCD1357189.1 oligosaccharide flippase family protein [Streptococcus pneumoniae]